MNSITNIHDLDKNVHLMKEYRKLALGKDMYNYNIVLGKQFGEQMYRAAIKKNNPLYTWIHKNRSSVGKGQGKYNAMVNYETDEEIIPYETSSELESRINDFREMSRHHMCNDFREDDEEPLLRNRNGFSYND